MDALIRFRDTCIDADQRIRAMIDDDDVTPLDHEVMNEVILDYSDVEFKFDGLEADSILPIVPDNDHSANCDSDRPAVATPYEKLTIELLPAQHEQAKGDSKKKKNRKCYSIPCEICGKLYTKGDMEFHLNAHNGIRPFACDIDGCAKTFASPFLLGRHKKVIHSHERRYECDICGKLFKHVSNEWIPFAMIGDI